MRYCVILLLALGIALPAAAAEVYRWTDAQGQVHFGATPPRGVSAERVDLRVSRPASGGDRAAAGSAPSAGGSAGDGTPDEPVSPQRDVAFERQQCEAARNNLEVLRNGGTNRRFRDADGNVVRYTEEELAREIARLEEIASRYCRG